jgi:hypothetical protein
LSWGKFVTCRLRHYKSLGLTDNQKQKVYKIRAEDKEKLDEFERMASSWKVDEASWKLAPQERP